MARKKKTTKKSVRRKVTKVIDGDTFQVASPVQGSDVIRIASTDAPEKGQRGSAKAKENLKRKIKNKHVTIKPKAKSYGRTVADVEYKGKKVKASPKKTKSQKKQTSRKSSTRKTSKKSGRSTKSRK